VRPVLEHSWNLSPKEAVELQRRLAGRVELADRFGPLRTVCGVDVSYNKADDRFFAAAAVLSYPRLELLGVATAMRPSSFPYVPGLLSFREIPVIAAALAELSAPPDLIVCDGQGYAHPRRFGLASHLGVLYDIPAIGAAKSRLVGEAPEPAVLRGSWSWLTHEGDRIGQLVRTRDRVAPLFVSPGHRVSFATARDLTLALCAKWRLPETTRRAHHAVNELRRAAGPVSRFP